MCNGDDLYAYPNAVICGWILSIRNSTVQTKPFYYTFAATRPCSVRRHWMHETISRPYVLHRELMLDFVLKSRGFVTFFYSTLIALIGYILYVVVPSIDGCWSFWWWPLRSARKRWSGLARGFARSPWLTSLILCSCLWKTHDFLPCVSLRLSFTMSTGWYILSSNNYWSPCSLRTWVWDVRILDETAPAKCWGISRIRSAYHSSGGPHPCS